MDRLAEIRKRLDGVIRGKWEHHPLRHCIYVWNTDGGEKCYMVRRISLDSACKSISGDDIRLKALEKFLIHSREDIQYLLDLLDVEKSGS